MPLLGATSETTTTTEMRSRSEHIHLPTKSFLEDSYYHNSDGDSQQSQNMSINTPDSSLALANQMLNFDPSACLFCPQTHSSLAQNLSHMSVSHSFHIQTTNLLVEATILLQHFHSVINESSRCLYCRKRLRSSAAAKQHMLHKGHCMYDIAAGEDAEVKGFYGFAAAAAELESVKAELTAKLEGLQVSKDRKKETRFTAGTKASTRDSESRVFNSGDERDNDDSHNCDGDAHLDTDTDASTPPLTSQQLIAPPISRAQARAQHQPSTFEFQLSRLRESDRRSMQHLPTSQQRALLATYHKQAEQGGRTASAKRGALESAGNSFGRLSSVRLVRIPPHSGRVQSLKH